MDTEKWISIIIGVLYILIFIAGILSVSKAADDPDYLVKSAQNPKQIHRAATFQFLMAIFYTGIAILLYPLLRAYNEELAVGFLVSRIIAVFFVLIGTITFLLILKLSRDFSEAGSSGSLHYHVIGDLLRTARDLFNHVGMIIALCLGGIMLYTVLIQSGLIPVWLSVWGIVGSVIALLASILVGMKFIRIISPVYLILNVPIALQELVFAAWLIFRGLEYV